MSKQGLHRTSDGLLLRSDVHALFDKGYVTITTDRRIRISRRLKKDFDNGKEYRRYADRELWILETPEDQPDPELLEWHADTVFLGRSGQNQAGRIEWYNLAIAWYNHA